MMKAKEIKEAVAKIDAIDGTDPEEAHESVDAILLALAPEEIREARARLIERCDGAWWFA